MTYTYFDYPTQVKFWVDFEECWLGGIGYGDIIICGCCGGEVKIKEIYECAPKEVVEPIQVQPWVNISNEIIGIKNGTDA